MTCCIVIRYHLTRSNPDVGFVLKKYLVCPCEQNVQSLSDQEAPSDSEQDDTGKRDSVWPSDSPEKTGEDTLGRVIGGLPKNTRCCESEKEVKSGMMRPQSASR